MLEIKIPMRETPMVGTRRLLIIGGRGLAGRLIGFDNSFENI
jgi:hypothetical protein